LASPNPSFVNLFHFAAAWRTAYNFADPCPEHPAQKSVPMTLARSSASAAWAKSTARAIANSAAKLPGKSFPRPSVQPQAISLAFQK
jgi:hypothetical protein